MSLEEEKLLPRELRDKQLKSAGNVRGWKSADIPLVVKTCRDLGFAIYSGHAVICLPDTPCEIYWKKAVPHTRYTDETWTHYVDRSCSEFLVMLTELFEKSDFEQEAIHSYDLLREKKKAGTNILDYLCIKVDIVSEARYAVYFR